MNCKCCITSWSYSEADQSFVQRRKAGGIIVHDGKLLLIQSRQNLWGFPKGGVEDGESELECAIREIKEETSLTNDTVQLCQESPLLRHNNTSYYFSEIKQVPNIQIEDILRNLRNDCTGIGWISFHCLRRMAQKPNAKMTSSLKWFVKTFLV